MTPRVSFFNLSPAVVRDTDGLADELRGAGINTLELSIWRAPFRDPTYPRWESEWEKWQGSQIDWCIENEFDYVARFDDGFNTIAEHAALTRWTEAIWHAAERTRDSKRCVGVELKDEMNPDPRMYPNLFAFADQWNVAGGPPLACPSWAPQAYEAIHGLIGYCSRQWPWWIARTYDQRLDEMTRRLVSLPNDDRRVCVMIPVCGVYYSERNGKPGFQKGQDTLYNAGMTPKGIENLMLAAKKIVAPREIQYRLYAYDFPHWTERRASGVLGEQQTGAGPHVDKKRWKQILEVCKRLVR